METINKLKGVSVQVDTRVILDELLNLVDCYTRPDADDLIIDTIHLEDPDTLAEFIKITGLTTDIVNNNQLLVLWR